MDWEMNRREMNDAFLAFTGICLCVALTTLVILFCIAKCSCRRRRRRKGGGVEGGGGGGSRKRSSRGAAFHSKSETVALGAESVEWIDARNTDLVSSTIKVQSLHATNSQLNNLINNSAPTSPSKAKSNANK